MVYLLLCSEVSRFLDTLCLLVDVVVEIWGGEVGLIPGLLVCLVLLEVGVTYPMFIRVVIPAPLAPRFSTDVFGLN